MEENEDIVVTEDTPTKEKGKSKKKRGGQSPRAEARRSKDVVLQKEMDEDLEKKCKLGRAIGKAYRNKKPIRQHCTIR